MNNFSAIMVDDKYHYIGRFGMDRDCLQKLFLRVKTMSSKKARVIYGMCQEHYRQTKHDRFEMCVMGISINLNNPVSYSCTSLQCEVYQGLAEIPEAPKISYEKDNPDIDYENAELVSNDDIYEDIIRHLYGYHHGCDHPNKLFSVSISSTAIEKDQYYICSPECLIHPAPTSSTRWIADSPINEWFTIHFHECFVIPHKLCLSNEGNTFPSRFLFLGSNDNKEWDVILSVKDTSKFDSMYGDMIYFVFQISHPYRHFRVQQMAPTICALSLPNGVDPKYLNFCCGSVYIWGLILPNKNRSDFNKH